MTTSDQREIAAADTAPVAAGLGAAYPGTDLAVPSSAELAAILGATAIDYRAWLAAMVTNEAMEETDAEEAGLSVVRAILSAESSEAALAAMNVVSVKDLLGETPGARTSVIEISDVFPLASTYEEGPGSFVVIHGRDLAEGQALTLSCGARAVQAALFAHKYRGWLPLKAVFTRRLKPTRAGYYPVNLEGGI